MAVGEGRAGLVVGRNKLSKTGGCLGEALIKLMKSS